MHQKTAARLRRSRRARIKTKTLGKKRFTVHRSAKHIYAQVIDDQLSKVIAQASTLDETLRVGATGNKEAAAKVGTLVAQRAKEAGVSEVAFDRSGYKYHGRVKSLAEAAREEGLVF